MNCCYNFWINDDSFHTLEALTLDSINDLIVTLSGREERANRQSWCVNVVCESICFRYCGPWLFSYCGRPSRRLNVWPGRSASYTTLFTAFPRTGWGGGGGGDRNTQDANVSTHCFYNLATKLRSHKLE